MRAVKWGAFGVLMLILASPALWFLYACTIGPARNDLAAERLLKELVAETELPENAAIEETVAWAGNSSGTGDHVELWAGLLIWCDGAAESAPGTSAESLRGWPLSDRKPLTADLEELFPRLKESEDWDGYYVVGTYGNPVTQSDLRGY